MPRRNLEAPEPLAAAPGHMSLVIVPDAQPGTAQPQPTKDLIESLRLWLDSRRLLGTRHHVVPPTYIPVTIAATLALREDANTPAVTGSAKQKLEEFFHPLKGGEDGQGWPFGGNVFFSRVYQRVFSVPGVERISALFITVDGEQAPECKDVDVEDGILLFSTAHDVQVGYSFDE